MQTFVKNGYEKRVRRITVSQQGKLERRVQQQAGQKALSLHALFHSP